MEIPRKQFIVQCSICILFTIAVSEPITFSYVRVRFTTQNKLITKSKENLGLVHYFLFVTILFCDIFLLLESRNFSL